MRQHRIDALGKEIAKHEGHCEGDQGPDQASSQLDQMIEQWRARRLDMRIVVVLDLGRRQRHGAGLSLTVSVSGTGSTGASPVSGGGATGVASAAGVGVGGELPIIKLSSI